MSKNQRSFTHERKQIWTSDQRQSATHELQNLDIFFESDISLIFIIYDTCSNRCIQRYLLVDTFPRHPRLENVNAMRYSRQILYIASNGAFRDGFTLVVHRSCNGCTQQRLSATCSQKQIFCERRRGQVFQTFLNCEHQIWWSDIKISSYTSKMSIHVYSRAWIHMYMYTVVPTYMTGSIRSFVLKQVGKAYLVSRKCKFWQGRLDRIRCGKAILGCQPKRVDQK